MENCQDQELLAMRKQLHLLKEKLDKEVIVNDHLLREVTRQKVRRLNRNVWQEGFACLGQPHQNFSFAHEVVQA